MTPSPLSKLVSFFSFRLMLILAVVFAQTMPASAADQKVGKKGKGPAAPAETSVIELDPEGIPPGNDAKVDGPRIFLWYSDGEWHLRTRTKKDAHEFTGTIEVKSGKVKNINEFDGLEAKKKRKRKAPQDLGYLNNARNKIDFKFRTAGGEDGFDFVLNDEATDLAFNLKIDGYGHGRVIRIGRKGQMPPSAQFVLPAHPGVQPTEKDADAAKKP